jgi:hypothetical protein
MSDDSSGETTTPVYDTSAYDTSATVVDSYSDDSTDWSQVGAESQVYTDASYAASDVSWDYWNQATAAYLEGDSYEAYNLTQASISMDSASDALWDQSYDTWYNSAETTTVTTYEAPADTWSAADTSGYTSYDASASTWSAADTSSYSAADTSDWSASE